MKNQLKISGWQIRHQEKLIFHVNRGNPSISLKFFSYPNYHQKVEINKFPSQCKIKNKGLNSFFLFHHIIGSKGIISLEREYKIIPEIMRVDINDDWGIISDIDSFQNKKYQQKLKFWSIQSDFINNITKQEWFKNNNLSNWVKSTNDYIKKIIKYREKQNKRLGANQVIKNRKGDCDEFTDMFITISRARGIPCRRLTGYFIRNINNSTTGEAHAWGEIFSQKKGWINIDIALNNIGLYSINYVILKIEEFNSSLSDYQIQTKHSSTFHHKWVIPDPTIIPIYK